MHSNPALDYPINPSNMVVYSTYSFVDRADLFYTSVQDIQFLHSEGCFLLPSPNIMFQFLKHYFMNVHPTLPMLNEAEFWDAYWSPSPPRSKMLRLLPIQAMLFASCNVRFSMSRISSYTFCANKATKVRTIEVDPELGLQKHAKCQSRFLQEGQSKFKDLVLALFQEVPNQF